MSSRKELIRTYLPAVILTVAGFMLAWQFVDPAPAKIISLSSGSADGAYSHFTEIYKDYLAKNGVELQIAQSGGSTENMGRLERGEVDVAFIQGGVMPKADHDLQTLGSLYFEPVWLFSRTPIKRLADLKGKRIAIGGDGSGVRPVALQLLAGNGLNSSNSHLLDLSGEAAANALIQDRADAVFFITSPKAPFIKLLASRGDIYLLSFERAEAYTRLFPYLASIQLPQGALDLAANIPASDTTLLATTATLVVRNNMHPVLQNLLLQAAASTHDKRGLFEDQGKFPSPEHVELPLSDEAARYYKNGAPFLQKYLPFWTANMIDRLKVMLLPLLALLLPLIKVMPPVYRWRIRSRIYHWYGDLQRLDLALASTESEEELAHLKAELEQLEHDIRTIQVPLAYAEELYHLRMHCALVRKKG